MADDPGSVASLGQLIPSVYYDLIARVGSGVPLVLVLVLGTGSGLKTISSNDWTAFLLLVGGGYVVGLLLTPFTIIWSALFGWPTRLVLYYVKPRGDRQNEPSPWKFEWLQSLWSRNDEIAAANNEAGVLIAKMEAEATLSQNLCTALVLLFFAETRHILYIAALNKVNGYEWSILFMVLVAAVIFRTGAYLGRQDSLYRTYVKQKANR